MPRFRPDLEGLVTYVPGRPIEDVAREVGIHPDEIVKLASNESPDGPFPGVAEAVAAVITESNRYPDNDVVDLSDALAKDIGVDPEHLWLGAGSTGLLGSIANAVGGPRTSAVFAWPSFIMYRIISRWAATEAIEIGLDAGMAHDLDAMSAAIRDDTTAVYLCNPNNPTGTIVGGDRLETFVESVPDSVLIVVDEAYHHFVDDPDYRSAIPIALHTPNVVVLRTLSKVYALAAHRIGFAVGDPTTLDSLRRTQAPFTVGLVAQTAALASLGQELELERRISQNASGRAYLLDELARRDVPHMPSQTNFIFMRPADSAQETAQAFTERGVIIRPMSRGWIRVTVGLQKENEAFVQALDQILESA